MKQFLKYIFLFLCAGFLQACIEDELASGISDGKPVSVTFSLDLPAMEVISPSSRTAGDAMNHINDLYILFYNGSGEYMPDLTMTLDKGIVINDGMVTISNQVIPADQYSIYAIANVGNDFLAKNATSIQSADGLKAIRLQWSTSVTNANNQMFGFFEAYTDDKITAAVGRDGLRKVSPVTFDNKVDVSKNKKIRAKLYRAASKVTVAFDATNLNKNIDITIESIRLGNLPKTCALWSENKPSKADELVDEGSDYTYNPSLHVKKNATQEESVFPQVDEQFPKGPHDGSATSLFLFENRQGEDDKAYVGQKDKLIEKMPQGAYLEVKGYYSNQETGSHGPITYRCMLGEDWYGENPTYNNYNVTRNRHYKVTLIFNKSAVQNISWRIEYEEEQIVNIPTEVRISYLHEAHLSIPFTVKGEGDVTVSAQIITNPWYDRDSYGKSDAQNILSVNQQPGFGFLCWKGESAKIDGNGTFDPSKIASKEIQLIDNKYTLNVQTESLGFDTDGGKVGVNNMADTFTGYNNYSKPRTAIIEVTLDFGNGDIQKKQIKVVQEPRVVNPIAIYRDGNENNSFEVTLYSADNKPIDSYGPWEAYLENNQGFELEDTNGNKGAKIESESGGTIRFTYHPNGTVAPGATPKCAVIVVKYSNKHVEHRIYVRQGYAPMAIGNKESLWCAENYMGVGPSENHLFSASPIEEGGWLKASGGLAILAGELEGFEKRSGVFKFSNGTTGSNYSNFPNSDGPASTFDNIPGYELPGQDDLNNIMSLLPYSGFGIAYDGKATRTSPFEEEKQLIGGEHGRRGVAICDATGRNMFFPIGKSGYGRRKGSLDGGLHYAISLEELPLNDPLGMYRPTLIDLYKSMGAWYWIKENKEDKVDQQLTFNYDIANIETQSRYHVKDNDACFARLIKKPDLGWEPVLVRLYLKYEGFPSNPLIKNNSGLNITCENTAIFDISWIYEGGSPKLTFKYKTAEITKQELENVELSFTYSLSGTTYSGKFKLSKIREATSNNDALILLSGD